ncbi:MAG: phosphomannomutase/phosphoglucomutase [Deltaproteobacteria bacterium]|nr:phosphomannomutase/phosphoglucomutase [Deltaproteobacteria bacterium]
MKVTSEIFRAYDIRGIADKDFNKEFAYHLGKAYALSLVPGQKVSVGYDCRLTSLKYAKALEKGLLESGLHVINIGMCPTPLLYFSIFNDNLDGGIMITGSHNPSEYNGFKICLGKKSLHGEEIQELKKVIEKEKYRDAKGSVTKREKPIVDSYIEHLHKRFPLLLQNKDLNRNIKVVIDSGNGTAALVAPKLIKSFGFKTCELFSEVDGTFPNHHPDPSIEENLISLIHWVLEEQADVGIAYDGDADRIGVVNEGGEIIWGDTLLTLFAQEIFKQKKSVTVIGEVKCSNSLYEVIKNMGGKAIMWKTGHSFIKDKLREENADIAGEMSGHIFFKDRYFGYDDALYASCRLLEILIHSNKKLSDHTKDYPKYYSTPEIRVPSDDHQKFKIVASLKKHFSKDYPIISIDGIRIQFGDGWGLIRPSNTQPILVMRFEAKTPERLIELQNKVEAALKTL